MILIFRNRDPHQNLRAWLGQLRNRLADEREAYRLADEIRNSKPLGEF